MSSPPTSSRIIAYSTFTSTSIVVGSGVNVEQSDDIGLNNIIIKNWRAYADSSTNFSVAIYASSNKDVGSTIITSQSTIIQQFIPTQTTELVYRDSDATSKIHWSADNQSYTSSVTLVAYYTAS
jgi:hypothetical protein